MTELSTTSSSGTPEVLDLAFAQRTSHGPRFATGGIVLLVAMVVGQTISPADSGAESYSGVGIATPPVSGSPSTWTSSLSGTSAYARIYESGAPPYDASPATSGHGRVLRSDPAEELRELTGLPVESLARLVGVSRVAYHDWLRGRPITLSRERNLLRILSVVREASSRGDSAAVRQWLLEPVKGTSLSPYDLLASRRTDEALGLTYLIDRQSAVRERSALEDEIESQLGIPFNRGARVASRGWSRVPMPAYLRERNLERGWRDQELNPQLIPHVQCTEHDA